MNAMDNLGPHLLGRHAMPKDDRDYKLDDFLRAAAVYQPDMTLKQIADARDLSKWHDIYAFWAWFKAEFLATKPQPTPPSPTPVVGTVEWTLGHISDQGQTGMCVGYTGLDWGNTLPVDDGWPDKEGQTIYYKCVPSDVGKPLGKEQGSDSRTLCKVLKAMGRIGAYAFTTDVSVAAAFIQQHGSVGTGIEWDNDMFNPDGDFYIAPGGGVAGGHEISMVGYSPTGYGAVKDPSFKLANHWGTTWADKGYAYIRASDWQTLINRPDSPGDIWAGLELPLK